MKSSQRSSSYHSAYNHSHSSSLYFPPTSFTKTFARLIVLIILFVGIFHHINSVDAIYSGGLGLGFGGGAGLGFGGGGGRYNGGGFGRGNIGSSFGRNGGSFGGRFGGGGGTSFFARPRWWILGAGTFGGRHRARANQTAAESIDSTEHVPATIDELAGVVGIFYVVVYAIYFVHKLSFKPGQYGQTHYSILHCLSFIAFAAFSIIAFHIPLQLSERGTVDYEEGSDAALDAWAAWFEPNSTMFIQLGDSPLNYFDLIFCGLGTLFTTFIILKDCAFTNGLMSINMLTKLATLGFGAVMLTAIVIGYSSSSWKIPLVVFALTSLVLSLLRFLGLVFIQEHFGLSVSPSAKPNFVPVSRSKCVWSNRLELLAGMLSIVFHILMAYNYEDATIAHINIIPIGMAGFGVFFGALFLARLTCSNPRYDRYVIPPTCGDSFGDGVSCREMLKMK